MRTVWLLAASLLICAQLADSRTTYKRFKKLLDSSDEDEHASAEVIKREEVRARKSNDGYRVKSACYNRNKNRVELVENKSCGQNVLVATGKYANRVNETGWGILEVETFASAGITDEIQAYAAGVVEGSLTKLQIFYHFRNTVEGMCSPDPGTRAYCKRLYRYLKKNLDWVRSQVLEQTNDYWKMVNLTYTQVTGINHGYATNATLTPSVEFELTPVYMLHLSGELFDLAKALKKPTSVSDDPDPGKCSGFLKITPNNKDLLFSHVSMSGYNTMNRLLKLYKFAYDKSRVPGHTYSFSSYAGTVVSSDDYTLISSGLASIETTISVFNDTLYTDRYIKPEGQLLCWVRSTISNQLAKTAKEWTDIFARYNSGTYNNQWTVVDYKLFSPGEELPNHDVVWILEQLPGYTESRDVTWFLRKYSYWPSYNIPYQTRISQLSGFDVKGNELDWWRWGYSPRAKIFQRDHAKVTDIASLRALMRYNNYQHDEFSRCSCNPPYTAEAGISARGDLNPANGSYEIPGMGHRNHGSLDYKGTNYTLFKQLRIEAIGGPAYDPLPPFSWATTDIVAPHFGQPTLWKFDNFVTEWENAVEVEMTPVRQTYSDSVAQLNTDINTSSSEESGSSQVQDDFDV